MKRRIIFCVLLLVFIMATGNAQERRPVAVSPGSESGVVVVGQRCPTFSWSEVQWTEAYRVVVFQAVGNEVLAYEEMEALAYPVISKEIQGPALSWTPSEEERLMNGGLYVWYVQAVDGQGVGVWSAGRMFQVDESVRLVGVEEKLRESLSAYGMSEEDIDRVLNNVTPGLKEVDVRGSSPTTQGVIGVQGFEDANNTAYGYNAGFSLTTGVCNSFFGANAGYNNTTGYDNTFVGHSAGVSNTTGIANTFLGFWAGVKNSTGSYNTFLGMQAGLDNTTGNNNTFIGHSAGIYNTEGHDNTFVGLYAGHDNTTGNYNTFLGNFAGYENTTGVNNTFLGFAAGSKNTTGVNNTFLGFWAGYTNSTGYNNTFLGFYAGYNNTTGVNNTFLGRGSGWTNSTGRNNTFLGTFAGLSNTEGNHNTFLGTCAGSANTIGFYNTFLGFKAGWTNTEGRNNTFLGTFAGYSHTTGDYNTFIGDNAGQNNTTGNNNTFIGHASGRWNTTGGANTCLGYLAGRANTTGFRNVFLGYAAGFNETGSHRLYIANSGTTNPLIYGEFDTEKVRINSYLGVGVTPTNYIDVVGGAYCDGTTWVNGSSREYKENIESLDADEAMIALEGLDPVKFNYKRNKGDEHVGFIAEDVPELVATKDRKGMSAMDVVAVLTKVVQEQQKIISELKDRITDLEKGSQEK